MDWIDRLAIKTNSPLPESAPSFWPHPLIHSIGLPETFIEVGALRDKNFKAYVFFLTFFDPPDDFRGLQHMLLPMRNLLYEVANHFHVESKEFGLYLEEFLALVDEYISTCPKEEQKILSANKLRDIQQLGIWRFHFHCSQVDRLRVRSAIRIRTSPIQGEVVNTRALAYLRDGSLDSLYLSIVLTLHLALKNKLLLKMNLLNGEEDLRQTKSLIYDETLACEHCLHLAPMIFQFENNIESKELAQKFRVEVRRVSQSKKMKWEEGLSFEQDLRIRLDLYLRKVHALMTSTRRLGKRKKKDKVREWNKKKALFKARLLPAAEFEELIEENEKFDGEVDVDLPFPALSGGDDDCSTRSFLNRGYGRRPKMPEKTGECAGDYEKNNNYDIPASWLVTPYQNALKQAVQLESMILNDNPPVWSNRCLLMQTINNMFKHLSREPDDLQLVILFMIHMGLSLEKITNLRVGVPDVISKLENPKKVSADDFTASLKNINWNETYIDISTGDLLFFIPKKISSYFREQTATYFEGCIESSNVARIPLPKTIMSILKPWVEKNKLCLPSESVSTESQKLFKYQKILFDSFAEYCVRHGKANSENISVSRLVSTFRAIYVGQLKLSPLYANLISQNISVNNRAQHFYSNISYTHLSARYRKANALFNKLFKQDVVSENKSNQDESRFGSKLVPNNEQLSKYFKGLREVIQSSLSENEVSLITWNALSLLCFRLLQLSTGIRPVRDGFPDWGDICFSLGWIKISDKDNRFFYESRIVPMASELREWLTVLADYQRNIFLEANFCPVDILKPFRKQPSQDLFLFFDEENQEIRPMNQKSIHDVEESLGLRFSFKENALRHNLLTRLLENDVDQNIIDFVMGHKHFGREPFGSFSMINVKLYSKEAIKAIDRFVVEPSLRQQVSL
jgi:hypothetical protein